MRNDQDVYLSRLTVNPIDHTLIADAVTEPTRQVSSEAIDVVVTTRVILELRETSGEFASKGRVGVRIELPGFGRMNNLKHSRGPCASSRHCHRQLPSLRLQRGL